MKKIGIILLIFSILAHINIVSAQLFDPVKWKYSVENIQEDQAEIVFRASIEKKWHLYGQNFPAGGPIRMSFTFAASPQYQLIGKVVEKSPVIKEMDEIFKMEVQYFNDKAEFRQKIKMKSKDAFTIKGKMEYQVCFEDKCVMFDPDFSFELPGFAKDETSEKIVQDDALKDTLNKDKKDSTVYLDSIKVNPNVKQETIGTTPFKNKMDNLSLWALFFTALGAGFIALMTPCIYPMIPLTVSFFLKKSTNRKKGIFHASVYGLSIITIFILIGVLVGATLGEDFTNWLSTHWFPNIFFFVIFSVFAASFFGMFEIVLPSWIINKSDEKAEKGGIMGTFFMAFTLVLVSFSCTVPIVGTILRFSAEGEFIRPVIGMLGFSLAFALPFSLFAVFPSALQTLPKSGGWLNSVKVVLGFIELAVGLKFLSVADQTYHWGILDREIYLALWIVIFSLMGFYLLGKIKFSHDSEMKYLSVPRLILVIITFSFVVYLIPGLFGAPLKALSGWTPPLSTHDFDLSKISSENSNESNENLSAECEKSLYSDLLHLPHGLQGYFDYEQGLACAKSMNKPVFIDFTGHGCVSCREMEANVWSNPQVLRRLKEDFIIIAMYIDDKTIELPKEKWYKSTYDGREKRMLSEKNSDIQKSVFKANAQPFYVLMSAEGTLLAEPRSYNLDIKEFIDFLDTGLQKFKESAVE